MLKKKENEQKLFIFRLIDWFVPKHLCPDEPETIRRARTVSGLILGLMAMAPLYAVLHYTFDNSFTSLVQLSGFFIGMCFLLFMRKFGLSTVFIHTGIFGLLAIMVATSLTVGGARAPGLSWIAIIPFIAIRISNRKATLIWTGISIFCLIAIFLWEKIGFEFKQEISQKNIKLVWLYMMAGLLLITATLALISDYYEQRSKQAVKEKSEESAMIKQAVDELGDAVIVYNIKKDQLYTNKQVSQLIGYSSEELLQHGIPNISADRQKAREIYFSTLEGNSWDGEIDIETKQGQIIPAYVRADAVKIDAGEMIALITIIRDISKQKQFQASLKESEEKYRLVTENATDAIWLRNLDLTLTYMSPSIKKIRGYTPEEIQAMSFEENLTPESMKKVTKVLETGLAMAAENPEKELIVEVQNYCKDGSVIWVEDHVKFLKDENNNPIQIIGVTRNIDQRKRASEQLKAARSELIANAHRAGMADIAAGTLHNVGNLLNSVKTSTHAAGAALEKSSLDELSKANQFFRESFETHEDFVGEGSNGYKLMQFYLFLEKALKKEQNTVKKEIQRLQDKIDAITDVIASQQRFAGFSSLSEEYSLETLVNDVLEIESSSLKSLGVNIRKEFKAIPDIRVQKTKLLHILVNLIKNAQDALSNNPRKNRKLLITLDQSKENVFLRVIDNGIGIAKEDQQKIFTHGFTTKMDGYGFGLHSSAIYMDDMGGKIWFESDGLNKGTAFVLKFPLSS